MRALSPIIASNGFAIFLTIVFLLPITAIFAFVVTTPLDDAMANFGLWMHAQWQWSFPEFDTQERFAKMGFALRSVVIAVGISFFYFGITNWLNASLARVRCKTSLGRQSNCALAAQSVSDVLFS